VTRAMYEEGEGERKAT